MSDDGIEPGAPPSVGPSVLAALLAGIARRIGWVLLAIGLGYTMLSLVEGPQPGQSTASALRLYLFMPAGLSLLALGRGVERASGAMWFWTVVAIACAAGIMAVGGIGWPSVVLGAGGAVLGALAGLGLPVDEVAPARAIEVSVVILVALFCLYLSAAAGEVRRAAAAAREGGRL
ncbi:MAG: hypothetical protein AAF677_15075 [Pseudomonadota bacterium]